jgi:hypothetical protein
MDCGQQFRLSGRRRTVGPGVATQETFRQKIVERFDADYLIKAREHSAGRNNATARLLALLSFLRNLGAIPAACQVEWDRAHVQAIRGDEYSDAAHHLPCQILVDRRFPWELTAEEQVDIPGIILELRKLFGDVWVLPKEFNAADSIAEANCLRGALVAACSLAISSTKPIRREAGVVKRGGAGEILLATEELLKPTAGIDHKAVTEAYNMWRANSTAAFRRAIDDVRANGTTVRGEDRTDEVVYILERYIRFADVRPSLFSGNNLARLEESLWLAS